MRVFIWAMVLEIVCLQAFSGGFQKAKQVEFIEKIKSASLDEIKQYCADNYENIYINYISQLRLVNGVVEIIDERELNPLYWAIKNNNLRLTHFLVESGARPSLRDKWGNCALHWAAYLKANRPMFEYLLGHEAVIRDESFGSILQIPPSLIEEKINPLLVNNEGKTASEVEENIEIKGYLEASERGAFALMTTLIKDGNLVDVEKELNKKIKLDYQSVDRGTTLLHEAYRAKDEKIQNLLKQHGASMDIRSKFGERPDESERRQRKITDYLDATKAIANNLTSEKVELSQDFDPNFSPKGRPLLLAQAISANKDDWVNFLRDKGANDIVDEAGTTVQKLAQQLTHQANINTALKQITKDGTMSTAIEDVIIAALENGAPIGETYYISHWYEKEFRETLLNISVMTNGYKLMRYLLENGASLDRFEDSQMTPFENVVCLGNISALIILIEWKKKEWEKDHAAENMFDSEAAKDTFKFIAEKGIDDGANKEILKVLLQYRYNQDGVQEDSVTRETWDFIKTFVPGKSVKSSNTHKVIDPKDL